MKYKAIAPVTLPVGASVKLTEAQQRRCRHLVKRTQDGWSEVTAELQFKAGEVFETQQAMSKANTVALDEAPAKAPEAVPAAKAKR